ncbi:hypothetical protein LCGC14_2959130, partial [marine sediment metagenome]
RYLSVGHVVYVRVGGGYPVPVYGPVYRVQGRLGRLAPLVFLSPAGAEPAFGVVRIGEFAGADHRHARDRDRLRLIGAGRGAFVAPASEQVASRRSERLEDDHVHVLAVGPARQIAPVGGPQRERELELAEAEELLG